MIDRRTFLTLSSAATLPAPALAAAETVLRIVPQADLKILDPVWTTLQLTQRGGWHVIHTTVPANIEKH